MNWFVKIKDKIAAVLGRTFRSSNRLLVLPVTVSAEMSVHSLIIGKLLMTYPAFVGLELGVS